MADKTGEQLSALMDGECDTLEMELALRRLAKDTELQVRWQRYQLISDTLKNNLPESIDPGFAERLRKAIDAEQPPQPTANEVLPLSRASSSVVPRLSSWYKPLAGFALAASVALIVVVGLEPTPPGKAVGGDPGSLASASPPEQLTAAGGAAGPQPVADAGVNTIDGDLGFRLNNYLVNHNEYLSTNGVHGVLPYVRMVGYEARR